jgi:uncharacterized HAD superfamily protein
LVKQTYGHTYTHKINNIITVRVNKWGTWHSAVLYLIQIGSNLVYGNVNKQSYTCTISYISMGGGGE